MNTPRTALEECLRLAELATPGPIFHGIRGDDSVWVSFGDQNNGPHAQGDCHLPPFDAAFMACAAAYLRTHGKALSDALVRKTCDWQPEDMESDCWNTTCGNAFSITEGTPSDNQMVHCCYCGAHLIEHEWTDGDASANGSEAPDA